MKASGGHYFKSQIGHVPRKAKEQNCTEVFSPSRKCGAGLRCAEVSWD